MRYSVVAVVKGDALWSQRSVPSALAVEGSGAPMVADSPPKQTQAEGGTTASFLLGLACAALVGLCAGSFLVPFKYAVDVKGAQYIVSFGIGAALAALATVAVYFPVLWMMGR